MIHMLGAIGLGLVVGWLLGASAYPNVVRPWHIILYLIFVVLILALVRWSLTWEAVLYCSGAILIAWLIRFLWSKQMAKAV